MNVYKLKIVNKAISLLIIPFVLGLTGCKETDGFSAASMENGGLNGLSNTGKAEMTPDAIKLMESRLDELSNIEEDVALKDEKISELEEGIQSLETQISSNASALTSVASPGEFENLKSSNDKLKSDLESLTQTYNDYLVDRKEQDQKLIESFNQLVNELSQYETSETSEAFKKEILERLEVYESDRIEIAKMISDKQNEIVELNKQLEGIKSNDTPEAITQKNEIQLKILASQEEIEVLNQRLSVLETLLKNGDSCALSAQGCEVVSAVSSDVTQGLTDNSAKILAISEKIKALTSEKENLEEILIQINAKIEGIDAITSKLAKPVTSDQAKRSSSLNLQKSQLLTNKSEATLRISEINSKIKQLSREITSL